VCNTKAILALIKLKGWNTSSTNSCEGTEDGSSSGRMWRFSEGSYGMRLGNYRTRLLHRSQCNAVMLCMPKVA
jgi:hypothetical protein